MKHLRSILLFLLVGVVINIGIAWGLAAYSRPSFQYETYAPNDYELIIIDLAGEVYEPSSASKKTALGIEIIILHIQDETHDKLLALIAEGKISVYWGPSYPHPHFRTCRFGLPFRSIEYYFWKHSSDWHQENDLASDEWNLWSLKVPNQYETHIPLKPIVFAFGVNTIFWAMVSRFLFLCPFMARRMYRRKHGLCLQCAYILSGTDHTTCPECGTDVAKT